MKSRCFFIVVCVNPIKFNFPEILSFMSSPANLFANLLEEPRNRSLRIQSAIFVVWEQVLDVSVEANIQRAATKITNIEIWILRLRLFSIANK